MGRAILEVVCVDCSVAALRRADLLKGGVWRCRSCTSKKMWADMSEPTKLSIAEKARADGMARGGPIVRYAATGASHFRWKGGLPKCACGVQLAAYDSKLCRECYAKSRVGVPRGSKRLPCSVEGCDRPRQARGVCKSHWQRLMKGSGDLVPFTEKQPIERRLLVAGKTVPGTGCREWTGALTHYGYGVLYHEGKRWAVHRIAWTLANGPIPDGMEICHTCDNPPCFEPSHLFLGTHKDNMEDMAKKGRAGGSGFVGEGHPCAILTEENVRTIKRFPEISNRAFAARFNVSRTAIYRVRKGDNWRHVGA